MGYERNKEGHKKQPYLIHRADGQPTCMAALDGLGNESEVFLMVTHHLIKGWFLFTVVLTRSSASLDEANSQREESSRYYL